MNPIFFFFFFLLLVTITLAHPSPSLSHQTIHQNAICPIVLPSDPPPITPRQASNLTTVPLPTASLRRTSSTDISTPRIINGNFASANLQRAVAVVFTGSGHCTGTLLSPRWVLTAAHCGTDTSSTIIIGTSQLIVSGGSVSFPDGTPIGVERVHTHPRFRLSNRGIGYDIAAVELRNDAPMDTRFFRLNGNVNVPSAGSFARTMGYGVTVFDGEEVVEDRFRLRQVDVPIVSDGRCEGVFGALVDERLQICAGYRRGGCSPCQGDSGGPLFQYDERGDLVQLAIVSFGRQCAEANFPSVFAKTQSHLHWLTQVGVIFEEAMETVQLFAN